MPSNDCQTPLLESELSCRSWEKGLKLEPLPIWDQPELECFILREDLHGGLFNGSKHRKYNGLFTYLKEIQPSCILIPGSLGSNHLIASCLYARRYGFKIHVITKSRSIHPTGNEFFILKLLNENELTFHDDPLSQALSLQQKDPSSFIMPLGGYHPEAARSAFDFGILIAHSQMQFSHIFLDAGTGLLAASVLTALEEKKFQGTAFIVAMGTLDFDCVLNDVSLWLKKTKPTFKIEVHRPRLGKHYGQRHKELDAFAEGFFKETGILLDPFYNSKLFYEAKHLLLERNIKGRILVVHSGGTLQASYAMTSG